MDDLGGLGRGVRFRREVGACPASSPRWAGDPVPPLSSARVPFSLPDSIRLVLSVSCRSSSLLLLVLITRDPDGRMSGSSRLAVRAEARSGSSSSSSSP